MSVNRPAKTRDLKTKSRKYTGRRSTAVVHRKVYGELPMIDLTNNSIPVINAPVPLSKRISCFFPNDLESSFHFGLLSCSTSYLQPTPEEVGKDSTSANLKLPQNISHTLPGNMDELDDACEQRMCWSPSSGKTLCTYHHWSPGSGKTLRTYHQSGKRRNNSDHCLLKHASKKTRAASEKTRRCQLVECIHGDVTATKSGVLVNGSHSTVPRHLLESNTLVEEGITTTLGGSDPMTLGVLETGVDEKKNWKQKRVTFAKEVENWTVLEVLPAHPGMSLSSSADRLTVQTAGRDDDVRVSDNHLGSSHCREELDLSDPPFPLSQKYSKLEAKVLEDWTEAQLDDVQGVKMYEPEL